MSGCKVAKVSFWSRKCAMYAKTIFLFFFVQLDFDFKFLTENLVLLRFRSNLDLHVSQNSMKTKKIYIFLNTFYSESVCMIVCAETYGK